MPRWTDAAIVGGSYSDDTRPFSVQDTVNLIPVMAEASGTRSVAMLRCAPGFEQYVDLGTNAPLRGASNVEGLLLVVSGTTLFKINPNATKTALGTIPGVGRVSMAHNQIAGGNQVAIANGQSGYVYETVKSTLTQITDDAFPGALTFDFVDGYITGIDPGRNFAYTSDLADATAYSTLDRYQAEGSPDKLMGQIVDHREWWLFGERTIEPYENNGETTGTFQRSSGTVIDVGAASPYCIAKMDNSVFWLGSDGIVYRANGYTPVRISTFPIEQAISRCTTSSAFAFTFEDRGHKIFYLTFQDGHTWGYDVASQLWHRRQSLGLGRWRINTLTQWNGMWLAGDFSNGKLYRLDWDIQSEDGETLERRRITSVLADAENPIIVSAIKLVLDTGQPQKVVVPTVRKTYQQTVGEDDPYLFYPLNDSSDVAIEVIQGFNGTYSGTGYTRQRPSLLPNGEGGSAEFDSLDALVTIPLSDVLSNLTHPFTIEGWARYEQPSANLQEYFVYRGETSGAVDFDFDYFGRIHLRRFNSSSGLDLTSSGGLMPPQTAAHIVVTSDTTAMKLYVNGALIMTTPYSLEEVGTRPPQVSFIGAMRSGFATGNIRRMQNIAIYRKVLTAPRISAHWLAAQP